MTLGQVLADNARRFPDRPAYVCGDEILTHADLYTRAVRLASAMSRAGVQHQDRISVLGRNSIEFAVVLAAAHLSGVVLAPVNIRLSKPEVLAALTTVTPKLVFADEEFALLLADVAPALAAPCQVVCFGTPGHPEMVGFDQFVGTTGLTDLLGSPSRRTSRTCCSPAEPPGHPSAPLSANESSGESVRP